MKGYTSKQSVSRKRNQTNTPHSTLDTALALLPTTLHQREDVHVATRHSLASHSHLESTNVDIDVGSVLVAHLLQLHFRLDVVHHEDAEQRDLRAHTSPPPLQ